ncbi:MAG: hypothetical protein WC683_06175 [bacterium]
MDQYRLHWQIPRHTRIESYQRLGLRQNSYLLWDYKPNLLMCDEAQWLRHVRSAGCARRVARYLHDAPDCVVLVLSGSLRRTSLLDYVHMLDWTLRDGSPAPRDPEHQQTWALLLDDPSYGAPKRDSWAPDPSYEVLQQHLGPSAVDRPSAQAAWGERLTQTPGVLISQDSFDLPLSIQPIQIPTPPSMTEHWERLRQLWITPDDWLLPDKSIGVYSTALQLALGFFYYHDPRPPTDWMQARTQWCRFCRRILTDLDTYDTEAQIRDACIEGALPKQAWDEWAAIKDQYVPHAIPSWLSTHALQRAADWGRAGGGGLIMCSHRAFGEALSQLTKWPYYGEFGLNASGESIDRSRAPVAIASAKACGDGFNLQHQWSRMLVTTPWKASEDWEQRIGRIHREGQQAEQVSVSYFVGCLENVVAINSALGYARATELSNRQPQKLLQAEMTVPDLGEGPAYDRTKSRKEEAT